MQRLLLGYVITLTVRGAPIKLEVNALASARPLADEFAGAVTRFHR